jgi:hypothetical protein
VPYEGNVYNLTVADDHTYVTFSGTVCNCGIHGDVIDFVMEREGCSFREACERLVSRGRPPTADPARRQLSRSSGPQWEKLDIDGPQGRLVALAGDVYRQALWRTPRAVEYLRKRGISLEIEREQRLGYADGRSLLACLRQQGTEPESGRTWLDIAADLGFLVARPTSESGPVVYHEFFYDRIIIPELRKGRPIWLKLRRHRTHVQSRGMSGPQWLRARLDRSICPCRASDPFSGWNTLSDSQRCISLKVRSICSQRWVGGCTRLLSAGHTCPWIGCQRSAERLRSMVFSIRTELDRVLRSASLR